MPLPLLVTTNESTTTSFGVTTWPPGLLTVTTGAFCTTATTGLEAMPYTTALLSVYEAVAVLKMGVAAAVCAALAASGAEK